MKNNSLKLRRFLISAAIIVLLIVVSAYYLLSSNKDEKNNFRFVKIERGNIESVVSSTGVLNPVITVQVGSQVSGTISKILTDFNKKVKKGELVALIDTTFLAASVRDAQSSIEKAKAQYDQSQRDLNRTKTLVEKNLAAQTDYEQALYNFESARASLKSAQANLDRAKINLKYAAITAPISGTVISRNVDVGQTVAASFSSPTLFLIANDLSKMQIIANVDESDIGQIEEGQKVTFTVQTYPDKTFYGLVKQVRLQPTTIQNVVNYSVVINVDNNEGLLLPGMTATIQFQIKHVENVLKVPNAALRLRPTQAMLAEAKTSMSSNSQNGKDSSGASSRKQANNVSNSSNSYRQTQGSLSASGTNNGANPVRRNVTTLWFFDENGKLTAQRIRTGLTDGQYTEIKSDKLQEGMNIISGITAASETKSTSPLQTNQPGGAPGMRRGF